MSEPRQFDADDLALFAMQLLPKAEDAQIRSLIESSPEIRREVGEVQGDLALYAATVEMHTPPALARERLLSQISREPKVRPVERTVEPATPAYGAGPGTDVPSPEYTPRASSRLTDEDAPLPEPSGVGRLIPWLGWAVAAGLAVATGNFYHQSEAMRDSVVHDHAELTRLTADAAAARQLMEILKDPAATRVTLTRSKEAPVPQGKVTYVADRGALLFIASNLEPLDTYKVYELWLIPASGAPVPAGTFHPDAGGNASVVLPKLPTGLPAKAFGITIEDEGGAETPTMPIILSGAATGA